MSEGTPPRVDAMQAEAAYTDEIDLLAYWNVLWSRRWMVVGIALSCSLLAGAVAFLQANVYRASTLLAPVEQESVPSLSAGLLGGLGALGGILSGSGGGTEEHLAVLKSRDFIWAFVRDRQLLPVLFADQWDSERNAWASDAPEEQPDLWDAYRLFDDGLLSADADRKSGLVTVTVEWTDPELAAAWANDLVARLNAFLRQRQIARSQENLSYLDRELRATQVEEMRKALFELISAEQKKAMLARTQKEFAFQVLDPAVAPDNKVWPRRGLMVVLGGGSGGMLAVFLAFVLEALAIRKKEESA